MLSWSGDPTGVCSFCDTNRDGQISPQADILPLINRINREGSGPTTNDDLHDVNWDRYFTPQDILCVINWINRIPEQTCNTNLSVAILDADTVGFTQQQVRQAIMDATEWYEEFNVCFEFVSSDGDIRISTTEIYVGNGIHGSGRFIPNNTIQIHDGKIKAGHHSGRNGPANQPLDYKVFGNVSVLERVVVHEMYHMFAGGAHSTNINCISHSNPQATSFCAAERSKLKLVFGGGFGGVPELVEDLLFQP